MSTAKSDHNGSARRFDGAAAAVTVVRTAPMYSEKQKNFTELIPHPLIPRVSIMWAFLESYLKKTADVFRIYLETHTILEQRIADLKDSFKLQSEGKTVDAELVGLHHIVVNYLVRYTLLDNALTQQQREELFFSLQKVRAQLSNAYGTTPAVIAVDKIDRYVVDLMFMLAESVTKAISDMSEKSWMECNTVLVAVLNVYRNRLNKLLEGFHVFINSAELGGATTPSFHAHAMSQRKDAGIACLPDENDKDKTLLTKKHFERLGPRTLDGKYIREMLEETAVENFITAAMAANNIPLEVNPTSLSNLKIAMAHIAAKINNGSAYGFTDFLKDIEAGNVLPQLEKNEAYFEDNPNPKVLSPRKRVSAFCRLMSSIKVVGRYWDRYSDKVLISPVSEIFAAAIMRKIKNRGIEEKLKAVITATIPEGMTIQFELTDYFCFSDGSHVTPSFTFIAEPDVWSLYGRPVLEVAEESLNTHWEKVYYISEAYLRSIGDENAEAEMLQKLDDLIGVSSILQEMARANMPFELTPNSLLYAGAAYGNKNDPAVATQNYLKYFAKCFQFARKKKILLLPGLCPRTTIIELKEIDGHINQITQVTPICLYMPVMELEQFERRFGPFILLREANARFELIGDGKDKFVIQKTGGECRTKGRPVFHRDKREHLYSRPRIDEEPLVEAISEMIKQYVFTKENRGNTMALYFRYYMRDYIIREYKNDPDVTWKKAAEILYSCSEQIYSFSTAVNIDNALQEAFARSNHANMEMMRAFRLITVIKEAREDAIKKMNSVGQRSGKLKKQIEEGHFMATYELIMATLGKCKEAPRFMPLIASLDLPDNIQTQEHILYIFAIRVFERKDSPSTGLSIAQRNDLVRDNLNTISFFKLAWIIVEQAFKKVKETLAGACCPGEDPTSHANDIKNSEYLMVELISRIIYKYISESPKRRQDYYSAIKYYYEDHPFFVELLWHTADELRRKSFQTEEHWKALGAKPKEGHVGLIEKCIIPAGKINQCVVNCEKYGQTMNEVITIIERNLIDKNITDTTPTNLTTSTDAPSCAS
ncbi:MAG: hypothetical protein L7F77_12715 [Candidatus Magnetominusculus sp. LBB02]|nr:hypothetical protein [Candidatus Magnetominusculus sp. LBB02]